MSVKMRQTAYYLSSMVPFVIGLALLWTGIDAGTAQHIGDVIMGLLGLVSAGGPAYAAIKVGKQDKDGLFDSPADQVVKNVQAVIKEHAEATANLDLVKQAVTSAVGVVPGMGSLAQRVINAAPGPMDLLNQAQQQVDLFAQQFTPPRP